MNCQDDMSALIKIIDRQFFPPGEEMAILRYIENVNKNDLLSVAVKAFIYGVIQRKRAERKQRRRP